MPSSPKVLLLVDRDDETFSASCFDETWRYLVDSLGKVATVTRPGGVKTAGDLLASGDFSSVLVVSPELFLSHSKAYRILRDQVRSFAEHQGGVVLFCGTFSSCIKPTDFELYFRNEWKLPWTTGDYHRTTLTVNPGFAVNAADPSSSYRFDTSTAELDKEYSQKALYVRGAPRTAALYVTLPESRVESRVFAPTSAHDPHQAAAVFQPYGKGYVGYLGDVNGEEGTSKAILALCGLTESTAPPIVTRGIPTPKAGGAYCSGCGEQEDPVGQGEQESPVVNPNRGSLLLNVYCLKCTASLTPEQFQTVVNSGQGGHYQRRDIDQHAEDGLASIQSDEQWPEWFYPALYQEREVIEEPENSNDKADEDVEEPDGVILIFGISCNELGSSMVYYNTLVSVEISSSPSGTKSHIAFKLWGNEPEDPLYTILMMFGQQRSQSGPSGLSINTGSANLFGSNSQAPATGGVLGSSKPLFGSSLNATTAAPSGSLFGTSITNQGGLFGTSMPPKPALNLFNSMGQEQSTDSNKFGMSQGQNQATSNQQQQQGGNIFASLNKPSSTGTQTQGIGQQLPSFTSQPFNATHQQPQKSIFSTSIGQYTQQQQAIPGVRVDISGLKSTTRFNDLYEEVQKIIENVDNFVLGQTQFAEECELAMPKIESALEYTPGDVEFCSRKLDALQQSLENDASAIDSSRNLVKKDATDARLSFRAIQNLRMPQQFQHTGLWGAGSTSQSAGPALQNQGEDGGSSDLVSYFIKQTEEMEKSLETLKKNLTEVETYLNGVEVSTMQQLQRVQFTRGRDGGQRSADDQIRELAAVLREFENGILGVAGKVGGVREQVQEAMLGEGVNRNRRRGLY